MDKFKAITLTVLVLVLIVVAAGVTGLPLSYDYLMGNVTLPDSILYSLEKTGEGIICTVSLNKKACLLTLADERDAEVAGLRKKLERAFDEGEIQRYRLLILETENTASRLRIDALK